MIVAAMIDHEGIEGRFTHMTKGWMAQVVRQTDRFGEIFVTAQSARQGPADLCNLDAVGQAIAIMVTLGIDKDLSLVFQAPESCRMNNTVAVALVDGAIIMFILRIHATTALAAAHGIGREKLLFPCFQHLTCHHHLQCSFVLEGND